MTTCPPDAAGPDRSQAFVNLLLGALVAGVLVIYLQTAFHEFGLFDDDVYITRNPPVLAGLTWDGIVWAFTTGHAANWHPLTWLSLMLDVSLLGPGPAGFHATNVLLHAVNAVLLFFCLRRLAAIVAPVSGAAARDALVFLATAFWAWHPLRVESVAWITERKDVLAACFGLLALLACVREWPAGQALPWSAWVFFALGCMAKPTLVMLPATVALLAWLMGVRPARATLARLGAWCALSVFMAVVTLAVQHAGGAMQALEHAGFAVRAGNAFVSLTAYLGQTLWPQGMAAFYLYNRHLPAFRIAMGAGVAALLALSCLPGVWRRLRGNLAPHGSRLWAGGMGWFLISLLPVIGLIQVGSQARADRYTYWAGIGLSMALLAGLLALQSASVQCRRGVVVLVTLAVVVCGGLAFRQTNFWRTPDALVEHTIAVGGEIADARGNLGAILADRGRYEEAAAQFSKALSIRPSADDYVNLANALTALRRLPEARAATARAIQMQPGFAHAWALGGLIAADAGEWEDARQCLAEARRLAAAKPLQEGPVRDMIGALEHKLATQADGAAPK